MGSSLDQHSSSTIIRKLSAEYVQIPLHNPFVISIRTATHANIIRWQLTMEDGSTYPGECVPVQYVTGETPDTVLHAAKAFDELLRGASVMDFLHLATILKEQFPNDVAARAGVEIAFYNAFSTLTSMPLYKMFGGKLTEIETDITIAKLPNATEVAERAWQEGFRIFKTKVGGVNPQGDIIRILAMQEHLPDAIFRLDANQGFTATEALGFIETLTRQGVNLELVEQPVDKEDIEALGVVAANSPVPVIADESCVSAEDAFHIFSTTPVHGVNVKLMKSGISGALEIIHIAKAAGRKLMVGCMLESPTGMAASVALACGTGAFDYVDLDGHLLVDVPQPITEFIADGPRLGVRKQLSH